MHVYHQPICMKYNENSTAKQSRALVMIVRRFLQSEQFLLNMLELLSQLVFMLLVMAFTIFTQPVSPGV